MGFLSWNRFKLNFLGIHLLTGRPGGGEGEGGGACRHEQQREGEGEVERKRKGGRQTVKTEMNKKVVYNTVFC